MLEEEKQPAEVREIKKSTINLNLLIDKAKLDFRNVTYRGILLNFQQILLEIMFSEILQDLFEKYGSYHEKIISLLPAIESGDIKSLEENPNARMEDFNEVGMDLYRLYLYLGIYRSIVGFQEFAFKSELFTEMDRLDAVLPLFWRLIGFMEDFELEIEGQEHPNFEIIPKNFPKDGVLRAKVKKFTRYKYMPIHYAPDAPERVYIVEWNVNDLVPGIEKIERLLALNSYYAKF